MLVNSEGGEAIFRNENGDTIIVPRNRRNEAMKYLLKDDHHSLDKLALDLPKAEHYASGGTVIPEDPIEGMMGPETTITADNPKKSIGNFLNRWGYEHSKDPATSFLGAVGQGLGAIAQLPQAAATYMLDPKGNVLPSKALQGTQIQKDIEMSAAQGNIGAKILKRPIVQDMLLDPLLLTSEIAKGVSKGSELINGLKKSELINDLGNKYLSNAYKLNPNAFKPNPEAYYRTLGKEGIDDAFNSGVIRPKQTSNIYSPELGKRVDVNVPEFPEGSYFNKSGLYSNKKMYNPDYIAEVVGKDNLFTYPERIVFNENIRVAPNNIPIEEANFYKQDWLKGYKQIKTPKSTLSPISKSWQIQDLPGLHLQSTMSNGPISKIIEPKTGLINTEQALAIIAKESGGNDKVALIRQGLGENIPKKMDYNEFRKTVQDQLIPLERQFSEQASNYGVGRLGYPSPKRSSYEKAIKHNEEMIAHYKKQIAAGSDNSSLKGDLQNAINNLEKSKKELATLPLENQTLILGNKGKFGRGSSAHDNPEETLGHIHFLRDAETPDVLTVTQIQSDAFQGTHRIMPKNFDEIAEKGSLRFLEEQAINQGNLYKQAIKQKDGSWLYPDGTKVSDKIHNEFSPKTYNDLIAQKKAEIENFPQKQLLDKNHQERFLQELVDYAGKKGMNKVRVPTSETAAKVQGYSKIEMSANKDFVNPLPNNATDAQKVAWNEHIEAIKSGDKSKLKIDYSPEHQTILKKYSEQPKTIKKLFKEEPKVVTDSKGNTWYEFDIPKKFKEGKGEIKALSTLGATLGVKQIIDNNKQQ